MAKDPRRKRNWFNEIFGGVSTLIVVGVLVAIFLTGAGYRALTDDAASEGWTPGSADLEEARQDAAKLRLLEWEVIREAACDGRYVGAPVEVTSPGGSYTIIECTELDIRGTPRR